MERTGYTLDVTTGQRKYGGPPPECVYSGQQPSVGTEVSSITFYDGAVCPCYLYVRSFLKYLFLLQIFVGKIPRDLFEDELVPLFEKAGPIWDLRLMMDPLTGLNRGYAFVTFCNKEAAQEAVKLVRFFLLHSFRITPLSKSKYKNPWQWLKVYSSVYIMMYRLELFRPRDLF